VPVTFCGGGSDSVLDPSLVTPLGEIPAEDKDDGGVGYLVSQRVRWWIRRKGGSARASVSGMGQSCRARPYPRLTPEMLRGSVR